MHIQRPRLKPIYALGLLVVIITLGFFLTRGVIPYLSESEPDGRSKPQNTNRLTQSKTGPTQSAATNANLVPQAQINQAPTGNANTGAQPERLNVTIRGVIKNPDGQPVPDALVALYKDNQKGADARFADENGQFQFPALPLRQSIKYTLQVKAPALSGEYVFTRDNADPTTHSVNANIILTAAPAALLPPPPDEDPTKAVRDPMGDVRDILVTISHSFNRIVFLVSLLALILLFLFVGILWRLGPLSLISDSNRQLLYLVSEHEKINTTLEKLFLRDALNQTLQTIPVEIRNILTHLQQHHGSDQSNQDESNQHTDSAFKPKQEELPSTVEEPTVEEPTVEERTVEEGGVRSTRPLNEQLVVITSGAVIEESQEKAIAAYRDLLKGLQPVPGPRYLKIDANRPSGSELEQVKIYLGENFNKDSPFVLFREHVSSRGWLFPNPNTSYTEDMSKVFPKLTREQFSDDKYNLKPIEAQTAGAESWHVAP